MKSPLASVVIPTYNRKELFAESFHSVVSQTYRPLELIVVDDGSTDGTASIREKLISDAEKNGVHAIWLFQENRGVSAARNHGMKYCSGKYLLFHDSDDLLDENRVALQVAMLELLQADMCAASKYNFNAKNKEIIISRYSPEVQSNVILSDINVKKIHWGTQTFMYRYATLKGIWWDEKISSGEDKDFNFRVLQQNLKVCCEPRAITYFRQHNFDTRLKHGNNSMKMYLSVHFKMLDYYREQGLVEMAALEQVILLRTVYKLYGAKNKSAACELFQRIGPFVDGASDSILEKGALFLKNCFLFCIARKFNIKAGQMLNIFRAA